MKRRETNLAEIELDNILSFTKRAICLTFTGGDFNLFNPCKCLNNEMNAPVIMQAVQGRILGKMSFFNSLQPCCTFGHTPSFYKYCEVHVS